jgi:tryptophan synthase alpha chain
MTNPIDQLFSDRSTIKLMTHVVAGFPDIETTEQLIHVMVENGVGLIEIQIPFSDPLADGPTISTANQTALDNGVSVEDCFDMVSRLSSELSTPLLFMTYANIPYSMGIEAFVKRSVEVGISGLIIPDLPFDESVEYLEAASRYNCCPIPVVSPGMSRERMDMIIEKAGGFIYTTLRVGITGAQKCIDERGLTFLDTLKSKTSLPIAAGFGISSAQMISQLQGRADAAVIGSHIINLLNQEGILSVGQFIQSVHT